MRTVSILLLNPIGMNDMSINNYCTVIGRYCSVQIGKSSKQDIVAIVSSGRADFNAAHLTMTDWIPTVVERYDYFVSPHREVGKATGEVIALALASGKKVRYWDGRTLIPVHRVNILYKHTWDKAYVLS